jgi:hypothetical protein
MTKKVSISEDECYPIYSIDSPSTENLQIILSDEKFEWIDRVLDEYTEVQNYLAKRLSRAYIANQKRTDREGYDKEQANSAAVAALNAKIAELMKGSGIYQVR